jgi:enoyl-CoA hydratase/carnithine racemase
MLGEKDDELVLISITPEVSTITLNSPKTRNALSKVMLSLLLDAITQASVSNSRTIVLTHTGSAFCSGLDLGSSGKVDLSGLTKVILALQNAPQPTIAVLNGPARAGGLGLMASCDLVIVSTNVTFAFTEVRIGAVPALISVPVLARVSTSNIVSEFLTGSEFSATRAYEIGLITHVAADPLSVAQVLISDMSKVGPNALRHTTKLLRNLVKQDFEKRLPDMQNLSELIFASDEAQEGMKAFKEKREPRWPEQ